ncbi:hypothetical protein HY492_01885 [Candidatus Woesearchaeota archaeon]|nr:hypothetical protein [Candidatus Woesearchaeota archaeon]
MNILTNLGKPRVLIFTQDFRLAQALETTFAMSGFPVRSEREYTSLDGTALAGHDIYIICRKDAPDDKDQEFAFFANSILRQKINLKQNFISITPVKEGEGYRININESLITDDPQNIRSFREARELAQKVLQKYAATPTPDAAEITADLLETIDTVINEVSGEQRISVGLLESQLVDAPNALRRAEVHLSIARQYEQEGDSIRAFQHYLRATKEDAQNQDALHSLGTLVMTPPLIRKLPRRNQELHELLLRFETSPLASVDRDQYVVATCLARGDEPFLMKALAVSEKHKGSVDYVSRFSPGSIAALFKLSLHAPKYKIPLYDAIENLVQTFSHEHIPTAEPGTVGMRLVKKGTGRHVVYDSTPTFRRGSHKSQHYFIKAFLHERRASAEIEEQNILALNKKYGSSITVNQTSLRIPSSVVLVQRLSIERKPSYLVTPVIDGERADRFMERVTDPRVREFYRNRIMDAGLVLQRALADLGRTIPSSPDFYTKRFEEKVLPRLEMIGLKLADKERAAALTFITREINNPLLTVDSRLRLPYTGSHTLKNILIDGPPFAHVSLEAAEKSSIARCDLEDASKRFFASDHTLSIEDSAMGLHADKTLDETALRATYDRLLAQFADGKPETTPSQTEQLLRRHGFKNEDGTKVDYGTYHGLILRTSLERHLTFTFDRIKEIIVKEKLIKQLEDTNTKISAFGKNFQQVRMASKDNIKYDALFKHLLGQRPKYGNDATWSKMRAYLTLQQDLDALETSKQHHLAFVHYRARQLWKGRRDFGYRTLRIILEHAR